MSRAGTVLTLTLFGNVWMRRSLFVTCLLLTAWIDPAGSVIEPKSPAAAAPQPAVEKATDGKAERDAFATPPETTTQLIEFDEAAAVVPETEQERLPSLSGDALAALDAVADGFDLAPAQPVPIPPHRAVPHAEVCEALASAASINDLPTPFLIRLIWQESGFRQDVISPAGAVGVAQFMPKTAAERGLDNPFNPLQAVRASARLLRDLIQQFGNVGLAAAAYNAGPRRVQDWLEKRGKLPQETQDYVERITGKKAEDWKFKTAIAGLPRVPARAPCQREAGLYAADGPEQIPLPPVQAKDESTKKIAKVQTATTNVVANSARSRSKVAAGGKAPKALVKNAGKAGSKGKKVKVADADGRK